MKHTLQQVFRSGKFVVGFSIFMFIVLMVIIYPLFVRDAPLTIIGQGTFFPPGIYVNVYDSIGSPTYTLMLEEAAAKRIASKMNEEDRLAMKEWLVAFGIPENEIDITDTQKLLDQWVKNYDPKGKVAGMTNARRNYFIRLDKSLKGILATEGAIIATKNADTGALEETNSVKQTDYVNITEVPSVRLLPLGTDNFGRDVLSELVSATRTSLIIGLVGGFIATMIGLILGLLAGYVGGLADDIIMFITNIFTVIPTFVLLILISYSIGQDKRGAVTIAVVIGFTSWVWTARAVRSQVFSLRNRDHVNSVETIRSLARSHHFQRHSAVYRFLCHHGADSANFLGSPGRGRVIHPWSGTQNYRNVNSGFDDELGDDLPGADSGKMVGVPPCDLNHSSDFILDELDEYRSRPGIQSGIKGIGD